MTPITAPEEEPEQPVQDIYPGSCYGCCYMPHTLSTGWICQRRGGVSTCITVHPAGKHGIWVKGFRGLVAYTADKKDVEDKKRKHPVWK